MDITPKNNWYIIGRKLHYITDPLFLGGNVEGLENLPHPPFIIAANHVSIPDGWMISDLMDYNFGMPAWFIARDDFWLGPWWSKFIGSRLGAIILDWKNPRKVIDESLEVLSLGGIVGIFPEGTRNPNPNILCLGKTGVARIALRSKCPVVPVGYFGPKVTTTWEGIKYFIIKRDLARIIFGKPIDFSKYYDKKETTNFLYRVTDEIMIEIGKLCGKRARLHNII